MSRESIRVTRTVSIPLDELAIRVSRSGGPGGQHANTSETRVTVAFDVAASEQLSAAQKQRVIERLGPVVRAVAQDERSQARNRELALERLAEKLADGLAVERTRRPTKPTARSVEDRLDQKRRRSAAKRLRREPSDD